MLKNMLSPNSSPCYTGSPCPTNYSDSNDDSDELNSECTISDTGDLMTPARVTRSKRKGTAKAEELEQGQEMGAKVVEMNFGTSKLARTRALVTKVLLTVAKDWLSR